MKHVERWTSINKNLAVSSPHRSADSRRHRTWIFSVDIWFEPNCAVILPIPASNFRRRSKAVGLSPPVERAILFDEHDFFAIRPPTNNADCFRWVNVKFGIRGDDRWCRRFLILGDCSSVHAQSRHARSQSAGVFDSFH